MDEGRMTIEAAAAYVLGKTGINRTRQTVYNWIKKGVKIRGGGKVFLESTVEGGQTFVSTRQVDEFLASLGRKGGA